LFILGPGDRYRPNGALASNSAIGHICLGGTCLWADPERELVGVYLGVSPRRHHGFYTTNSDLFQNAVTAAIVGEWIGYDGVRLTEGRFLRPPERPHSLGA
jgi:hypothetical protein